MNIKHGKIGALTKRVKVGFVGTCEKYYTEDQKYPMIRTTNLTETGIDYTDLRYVTQEFYDKNKKSQLHDGDVLIARFGTSGTACVYHGGDAQCLNAIIVEPDIDTTIPEYLAIVINSRSVRDQVNRRVVGSTQAILNTKVLSDIEISLPSLEDQKRVVDIFQSLQRICDQRTKELCILDELTKARFVEMFGDPSENPHKFPEVNISAAVRGKVSNGFFAKRDEYVDDGNVSVLGVAYVVNRMYSQVTDLPRTNADQKSIQKFAVKYGDMLFCRSSLVAAGIGKASIVPDEVPENTLFECHVIRLPLDLEKCVPEYMQTLSTMDYFRNQIIAQSKTATMTTIGQDGILKANIILPPLEKQKEFYRFVKQVDKSKVAIQKSLDETRLLFDSLMQQYFG